MQDIVKFPVIVVCSSSQSNSQLSLILSISLQLPGTIPLLGGIIKGHCS